MLTPNLVELQISLHQEEDVEYLIRQMPNLHNLNNISVSQSCRVSQNDQSSHMAPRSLQDGSIGSNAYFQPQLQAKSMKPQAEAVLLS